MLEGQTGEVQQWLAGVRKSYGVIPVMLPAVAWNDDLTPWPAGPIFKKGKSFAGEAEAYLNRLAAEIIPGLEKELEIVPEERWFIGVSLAGLFGVWSAARMRLFTRVAAISGSFWYPGFTDWLPRQTVTAKQESASEADRHPDRSGPQHPPGERHPDNLRMDRRQPLRPRHPPPEQSACRPGRQFPLQRTHLSINDLHNLTPPSRRGINLHKQLIIKCVRCSGKSPCL